MHVGPFPGPTRHEIACRDWTLTYGTAPAAFAETSGTIRAINPPADFVELFGEGAPVAPAEAVPAVIVINPAGANNNVAFTAVAAGVAGNDITVEYRDPEAEEAELSVEVEGLAIVVHLATDSDALIVTTAAQIVAAVNGDDDASALVTAAPDGTDSGTVTEIAPTNLADGTDAIAGTGAGVAGPGSRYTDIDSAALYINTGDADEPAWSLLAFD